MTRRQCRSGLVRSAVVSALAASLAGQVAHAADERLGGSHENDRKTATGLAGYLPGQALGLGASLPAGVYWEWRKLCLRPGYHRSEWGRTYPQPRREEARFKLTLIPIADDMTIAPHMVRKLPAFYPHAQLSEVLLDPARLGLKSIGHGGAFLMRNLADDDARRAIGTICPNVLFPYARAAVSNLVTQGGFPQFLLPPVNFDALYERALIDARNQGSATKN